MLQIIISGISLFDIEASIVWGNYLDGQRFKQNKNFISRSVLEISVYNTFSEPPCVYIYINLNGFPDLEITAELLFLDFIIIIDFFSAHFRSQFCLRKYIKKLYTKS